MRIFGRLELVFVFAWFLCLAGVAQVRRSGAGLQSERTAQLEQWVNSHEVESSRAISEFSTFKIDVTKIEVRLAVMETRVESIEWWMKLALAGIAMQLINMAVRILGSVRLDRRTGRGK